MPRSKGSSISEFSTYPTLSPLLTCITSMIMYPSPVLFSFSARTKINGKFTERQKKKNPDFLQFITIILDTVKFKEVKVNEGFCCF